MSATAESKGKETPIQVLFALHNSFDTLDFAGPLQTLTTALHDFKNPETKAFQCSTVADEERAISAQGVMMKCTMDYEEAHDRLDEFDVLIVPGGPTTESLKCSSTTEPGPLIKAFCQMQVKDTSRERTILSIGTGSLFLATQGIFQGFAATTHPDMYTKLEILCMEAARRDLGARTDVMEERYVVNNARFDLGENWEDGENPFILSKRPDVQRKSSARKGSDAWKLSRRRESLVRRGTLPLGGMRVISSGGGTAGMDAALYLVAALVDHESAIEVARLMQLDWKKGVTVEGIDV